MKPANIAFVFGLFGLILMMYAPFAEQNFRSYDCSDGTYVNENYSGNNPTDKCYDDQLQAYDRAEFSSAIGYALMLFSLVLMIGANRLQD